MLSFKFHCYSLASSKERRCYNRGDYNKMRAMLDLDWESEFSAFVDDPSQQWSRFLSVLHDAVDAHIPKKTSRTSFGESIPRESLKTFLAAKRKKSRCWQRFMENKHTHLREAKWREYCRSRNKVRAMTRNFQRQKENTIAKSVKVNPKVFWDYVSRRTKTRGGIPHLQKTDCINGSVSLTKK